MESQPNNPLHGIKLEQIINDLVAHYGWEYMGYTIKIKCFTDKPSVIKFKIFKKNALG